MSAEARAALIERHGSDWEGISDDLLKIHSAMPRPEIPQTND